MQESYEFALPDAVEKWIFKRGGSSSQKILMGWLWNELRKRCWDAEIRTKERYIGLYIGDSNKTFAKINSKSSGPVFGISDKIIGSLEFTLLQPVLFADWGGAQRGFVLEKHSAWELLDLLVFAYEFRNSGVSDGWSKLQDYKEAKQKKVKSITLDMEALKEEESSTEGTPKIRTSVVAERDPKLRLAAISLHGLTCKACGFNFEAFYGQLGEGYIEVHHVDPFHAKPGIRETDPNSDLDVLCSNCHRMIHRHKSEIMTVEELRRIVQENCC